MVETERYKAARDASEKGAADIVGARGAWTQAGTDIMDNLGKFPTNPGT